jgi:ATP-dependent helicase/nuclease subunit A
VARLASIWEKGNPAAEEALACLAAPGLAEIWRRPEGAAAAEVWRERSFELVLDGAWVTGIFDRVTIVRDTRGRPQRAAVWDFKTDAVDPAGVGAAIEHHGPQLQIYRKAVARLMGLPLEAVVGDLVLTRLRRRAGG